MHLVFVCIDTFLQLWVALSVKALDKGSGYIDRSYSKAGDKK
jgi:hypothetical protein